MYTLALNVYLTVDKEYRNASSLNGSNSSHNVWSRHALFDPKLHSFSKEANRHNLKMEQLESDRVKWDQNYANEQREYTRKRQQRADAKEDSVEDRSVLDQLLLQKDQIKGQLRTEVDKHRRKNPYYFAADLMVTASVAFVVYKTVTHTRAYT